MVRWTRAVASAAIGVAVVMSLGGRNSLGADGQDRPLPDREAFLRDVQVKLRSDGRLQGQYTFQEREVRIDYEGDGRPKKRTETLYEIYPSVEGSPAYRRLVETNGRPESASKLADADRKHRERVLEWSRARADESASARAAREKKAQRAEQEEARMVAEIFRVLDIQIVGRETRRGRSTIAVTFARRPGVEPTIAKLGPLTKMAGRAWIDEEDREVVALEAETTDTIAIGLGVLARVHKGSTFSFERQKVNGEVWLPVRASAHPKARIALLKRVDFEETSQYSDYRKFTVETATSFRGDK